MSDNRLAEAMERAEAVGRPCSWSNICIETFQDRRILAAHIRKLEAEVERLRRIADEIPPYLRRRIEDAMMYEDDPGEEDA